MVNASWQFPQFWLALYHTNLLMLNWYDLPPLSVKCWWHAKFRVHSFLFRQRRWLASCQIHTTMGLSIEFHSMGASFLFRHLAECSDLNTVTQRKIVYIVPHEFTCVELKWFATFICKMLMACKVQGPFLPFSPKTTTSRWRRHVAMSKAHDRGKVLISHFQKILIYVRFTVRVVVSAIGSDSMIFFETIRSFEWLHGWLVPRLVI